jgi:hypothetical protein
MQIFGLCTAMASQEHKGDKQDNPSDDRSGGNVKKIRRDRNADDEENDADPI